jgi:hypothetical protein
MIPSPLINNRYQSYFRWLTARYSQARLHMINLHTTALAIISRT